jgi:hypothetical protein
MLATPADAQVGLPGDGRTWAYEVKWDGMRVLADVHGGRLRLTSRTGRDITVAFPELRGLAEAHPDVLLDGEVIVFAGGTPSFAALADRIHVTDPRRAASLASRAPATLIAFDVLRLYGVDLLDRSWQERREALERLTPSGTAWQLSPVYDDRDALRVRVAELEATLGVRIAEVVRAKSDLDAFEIDYRKRVGILHEQLDKLELEIAEAELGELSKRVASRADGSSESPAAGRPAPAPRYTTDAARKLFRDVAKAIHPDLALDESTRDRRHALMVEANRAYALGDEEQLRFILDAWERSPEAVRGLDPEAIRLRLVRRIAQIEEQQDMLARDLAALKDSPLGKLKAMVDEAAAAGKDLVRDMIGRLKRDILVATNRLDAMRPPD